MSEYILIAVVTVIYLGKPAITSEAVTFPTQVACEAAKSAVHQWQAEKGSALYVRAACVPRNVQ